MTQSSPYSGLPSKAFWRTGVAETTYPPQDLYTPRFQLKKTDRVVTAGSCFAQHVGRALRSNGFNVLDKEPASEDPRDLAGREQAFGYGLYTARYGNIYTARQLKQLLLETLGRHVPADLIWERDGRFFDSQRPNIEPDGFETVAALYEARERHLMRVHEALTEADVFVFTLGLTEAWIHSSTGQVYATAPGTIAGSYDPEIHAFKNFRHHEIIDDMRDVLDVLHEINPGLRVLLTVSPVPLTATATGEHVLAATTYSKSVLRACAGELHADNPDVDYFPSYEIITSVRAGERFFEQNLRSVTSDGVALAMKTFMAAHMPSDTSASEDQAEPDVTPAPAESLNVAVPDAAQDATIAVLGDGGATQDIDVACAEAVLREGDRVLEIGARDGRVSASLAKSGLASEIRAYEPHAELIPQIRAVYEANGVDQKVDLRNALPVAGAAPAWSPKPDAATPETVQFSDLLSEFQPDLLIVNTVGGEMDFLLEADLSAVSRIALRWYPQHADADTLRKAKRHVKGAGFKLVRPLSTRVAWAAIRQD